MRLVVDTNVFVSAGIRESSLPFRVVDWINHHGGLLKSTATEQELLDVLQRPHIVAITSPSFRNGLPKLLAKAELVRITKRIDACRDPTDDKFLELAVNGRADLIVSGDKELLTLNPFEGIPIVTTIPPPSCKAQRGSLRHRRRHAAQSGEKVSPWNKARSDLLVTKLATCVFRASRLCDALFHCI